jgi:hypothetical protein
VPTLQFEQLWLRQIGPLTFELCCISFHLYDLALGDVVQTDEHFDLLEVVDRTQHATDRVWLRDQPADRAGLVARLAGLGALLEWEGHDVLAIDASDRAMRQAIADDLWAQEQAGQLQYETGDLAAR